MTTLNNYYTSVYLPANQFGDYIFNEKSSKVLEGLSHVNIFIGANNSGKSRFLRRLSSLSSPKYKSKDYDASQFTALADYGDRSIRKLYGRIFESVNGVRLDAFSKYTSEEYGEFVDNSKSILKGLSETIAGWNLDSVRSTSLQSGYSYADPSHILPQLKNLKDELTRQLQELSTVQNLSYDSSRRYYIPVLRGMRPLCKDVSDPYYDRTLLDYAEVNDETKITVFTGLKLYNQLKAMLLGEPEERELVKSFESFLSESFFNSQTITLIPRDAKDTVHIKIGHEPQFPIYDLGDGLQNIITIMFNIFVRQDKCQFFIEEPELYMHPGLQRTFMSALAKHDRHQFFLTTHSNHLLELSSDFADISIYKFQKKEASSKTFFVVDLVSHGDHSLLNELGVTNSSVFLTNATIWVEGITDRLYIREFLLKYIQELQDIDPQLHAKYQLIKEDIHFSFVEYQGSNLTHWTFCEKDDPHKIKAKFLCAQSFLIADGDVSGKGTRAAEYRAELGDHFVILPGKEIENLIPVEILRRIVLNTFSKFSKETSRISYQKYSESDKGLGKYLDRILGQKYFATESGTIKCKMAFCESAIKLMRNEDTDWHTTPLIKDLCSKILKYVAKNNHL